MSNLSDFFGASGSIASIQRGTTSITISNANAGTSMTPGSATATINAVVPGKTIINTSVANGCYSRNYSQYWGFTASISCNAVLTNATTVTFTTGVGFDNYDSVGSAKAPVISWEVVEYV